VWVESSTNTSYSNGAAGADWGAGVSVVFAICRRRMRLTVLAPSSSRPRCERSSNTSRAYRSSVRRPRFRRSSIWPKLYPIPSGPPKGIRFHLPSPVPVRSERLVRPESAPHRLTARVHGSNAQIVSATASSAGAFLGTTSSARTPLATDFFA